MLELHLLGPVRLRRDGAALPLPVKKSQALLMLLARHERLPRAQVVALLWPQLDESTGRRNLRRELARLREVGAADAVLADDDFLALAPAVRQDVSAFEAALSQGRPDDALALWRGPPADGLSVGDAAAFDDWCSVERGRLLDARRRALEASAVAAEARGDIGFALQRIELLLHDDPLQEQRHRDAMRLLAALGRREAALAQFELCRRGLQEELGLAPMPETVSLAAALRQAGSSPVPPPAAPALAEPAAARAGGPPARLLPDQLPFVGREAEIRLLEAAWSSGRALVIEGGGGVGKSRLATDFVAAHGPYARTRSLPGDRDVPYASFTRALRLLLGAEADLGGLAGWIRDELARLVPELSASAPASMHNAAERNRFLEACTQAWLRLAGESFDAVIFDDWHQADAASQALVAFIAQRRQEDAGGAAALGGAREVLVLRPEGDDEAATLLRRMIDASHALHLQLDVLPAEAVLDLVRQLSGASQPSRFVDRLHRATAGNPFFLAETLRHLAEQGLLSRDAAGTWSTPFDEATEDYRELPLPASVRDAVLARIARLSPAARRLLEAAALAAEPFAAAVLAPACALSELDALLGIESAVAAQLLREHEAGGFAFAHDLVQQAIDGSITAERRRLVHRRLALGAEAAGASPGLIATHHEAAGEAARAVPFRLAAGDAAGRVHAWAEAIGHWNQGLADQPTASQAALLHRRLARWAASSGRPELGSASARALQALAGGAGLAPGERIECRLAAADHLAIHDGASDALGLLEQLPKPLEPRHDARARVVRSIALRRLGRNDEARTVALEVLAMPELSDRERGSVLAALCLAEQSAGRTRQALEHAAERVRLATRTGRVFEMLQGEYLHSNCLRQLGEFDATERALRQTADRCGQFGFVSLQRTVLYALCATYLWRSRHAQALQTAREGWDLHPPMPRSQTRALYLSAFVHVHLARGDLGDAWSKAVEIADEALAASEATAFHIGVATCSEIFALLGAADRCDALLSRVDGSGLLKVPLTAYSTSTVCARVALMSGQPDAAAAWLAAVGPASAIQNPRVRDLFLIVQAELHIAQGDAGRALAILDGVETADQAGEDVHLRQLAALIAAQSALGALDASTVAAAQAELAKPAANAMLALALHQALAAAARAGCPGAPADAAAACQAHIGRLADSLAAHPAQRAGFLEQALG